MFDRNSLQDFWKESFEISCEKRERSGEEIEGLKEGGRRAGRYKGRRREGGRRGWRGREVVGEGEGEVG